MPDPFNALQVTEHTPSDEEQFVQTAVLDEVEASQGVEFDAGTDAEEAGSTKRLENIMSGLKKAQTNFQKEEHREDRLLQDEDFGCTNGSPTLDALRAHAAAMAADAEGSAKTPRTRAYAVTAAQSQQHEEHQSGETATPATGSQALPNAPLSWSAWAAGVYSWTWKPLIRPPRELYNVADLGRNQFVFRGRAFQRVDDSISNSRGQRLVCSHFRQVKRGEPLPQHCIVYLHGSSSSRLEAFDVLPVLLPAGLSVFCLDLSGSGQSEGDFISLGYHEEQDLRIALRHLREDPNVRSISLWGRSMGATAAVMRAAEDDSLAACVLDSPFTDLKMAIMEYIQNSQLRLPGFAIDAVIHLARSEVQSRASFDIFDVAAIKYAERATCPALFAVAADDSFVLPHHTQELHNKWGGQRQLRFFEGGHNGRRPKWFLDEAASYLLQKCEDWRPKTGAEDTAAEAAREKQTLSEEARRRTYWL